MNESIQLIVSKIEELIVAVGGRVQSYYPYVVKQQIIQGIISIMLLVVSIIFLIIGLTLGHKIKWEETHFHFGEAIVLTIIGGVGTFIFFVYAFVEGIPRLLNTHYFAVQKVIEIGSQLIIN